VAVFEIPLSPKPQSFAVRFPNGKTYGMRLVYLFTPDDCWELDISDDQGNAIVQGIPLITGADLLAQYEYLDFGCALYCTTDGDRDAPPRFFNLGVTSHLWLSA
jgi:hypothetical protein